MDALPSNMNFITGSVVSSGSSTPLPNTSFTQVGTGLFISFDTGALSGTRSLIPLDNTGTATVQENIVLIHYTVKPTTSFLIQ